MSPFCSQLFRITIPPHLLASSQRPRLCVAALLLSSAPPARP